MSCFIPTATPPPKRFCPSWDLNTPSLKGSATSSLGVSKWCLSLISWNIPELSDSKLLWGGTVRKFPNLQAALGVTPVRPLLVRRETAPRPLGISAKLWGCHLTSQGNHILFSTFVHTVFPIPPLPQDITHYPLSTKRLDSPPPWQETEQTMSTHPLLGLSWTPSPPLEGGEGRGEDTWSPSYLARVPTDWQINCAPLRLPVVIKSGAPQSLFLLLTE